MRKFQHQKKDLGKKLKALRKDNRYSQYDIALKMGMSQSTYSRAEAGLGDLSILEYDKLLSIYGLDHQDLAASS